MDKRYQVFISSTFSDLKDERQQVIQTIMELDCIPSGMELFPAADEEQFEFIKKVIDDCDYYVLILAGRYGSVATDGISYTEKEFDYARSRGIPVLAFLHRDPDQLPLAKSEKGETLRERLRAFTEKVKTGRMVNFWTATDQLPGLVALSLPKTIKTQPAVGWVRADKVANEDLLSEINELRKENVSLRQSVAHFEAINAEPAPDLAELDSTITVDIVYWSSATHGSRYSTSVTVSWRELFALIAPYLIGHPTDSNVKSQLTKDLLKKAGQTGYTPHLEDQEFQTIKIQLRALQLVTINYAKTMGSTMNLFWNLTPKGEAFMMELRTVKKE